MLELEKYRKPRSSIFEQLTRRFLKLMLSGFSLFLLASVAVYNIYEMFTKPKTYGAIDVYNNVSFKVF